MSYDLIIRDGTVVDGSGLPRYRADVAIAEDRIAAIGKINDSAKETIDAETNQAMVLAPTRPTCSGSSFPEACG